MSLSSYFNEGKNQGAKKEEGSVAFHSEPYLYAL